MVVDEETLVGARLAEAVAAGACEGDR
jgi:hypothetical protein